MARNKSKHANLNRPSSQHQTQSSVIAPNNTLTDKDVSIRKDETHTAKECLCNDALATLPHHYEMIKLQQEVRDRWYRYYLILTGSILSLSIAIFAAAANSKAANSDVKENLFRTFSVLGWIIPVAMALIFLLGVCFLVLYQWQILNYRIYYNSVSRIFRMLALLHSETLSKHNLPNPFEFSYIARANLNTRVRASKWSDQQFWEADFWANAVTFLINSFCAATGYISYIAYNSARRSMYFSITLRDVFISIAIFILIFTLHIVLRQVLMRLLLSSHVDILGST